MHDYAPDVAMAKRQASQQLKHVENTHTEFLKKLHKVPYMYVRTCTCIYICTCTCTCTCIYICTCTCTCIYLVWHAVRTYAVKLLASLVVHQIVYNSLRLYADNLICMDLCCCSSSEALKLLGSEVHVHVHVYTSVTVQCCIYTYMCMYTCISMCPV